MTTTTSRRLELQFGAENANNVKVTVYDHKADLTSENVALAMNDVVAMEVLQDKDGHLMTDVLGAKEILTTENILF